MRVVALVCADQPYPAATVDALTPVRGEPLLAHTVRALTESGCVDQLLVTAPTAELSRCRGALDPLARAGSGPRILPCGGRATAIRTALSAVEPERYDVVLVHDPSHAFTPVSTIRSVAETVAAGANAALPVLEVTDTVKLIGPDNVVSGTRDRAGLRSIQAPVGFAEHIVREANARDASDTDLLSTLGSRVRTVAGHPHGGKLVTAFDIAVAEGGFADIADLSAPAESGAASAGKRASAGSDNREGR